MSNTANSLPILLLMIILLLFFSTVSYADAVDDAIERHQQESAQRYADKQLRDALDRAKRDREHERAMANFVGEPAKDEISFGKFFLGFIFWAIVLVVLIFVYEGLFGEHKWHRIILVCISLFLLCLITVRIVMNKFSTYPIEASSGLLSMWITQGWFIYFLSRSGKKQKTEDIEQRKNNAKESTTDAIEALGNKIGSMTVADIAIATGKTERGIRMILIRRGITVCDFDGAAKLVEAQARADK